MLNRKTQIAPEVSKTALTAQIYFKQRDSSRSRWCICFGSRNYQFMHFCQSLQGFVVCQCFFFEHCAATTLACCRFSRDGFAKKICSPLTRLHNKLGQHHRYQRLAFHTAVQVKWIRCFLGCWTWVRMGPQLHSTCIGEFIGFGFDPKALWRGVCIQEGSLRCCKLWESICCMCWASTGPEQWLHKDSEVLKYQPKTMSLQAQVFLADVCATP